MPSRTGLHLVIDARPRGPRGPLAGEQVLGRSVLARTVALALTLADGPVVVHARPDEHQRLQELVGDTPPGRVVFAPGPPPEGAVVLRTDRIYDPPRLRRVVRRGRTAESAVVWRLDGPEGLHGAEAELIRRQTYQPLGKYWALEPARRLAEALRPTRVRPNALTLASCGLMFSAAGIVATVPPGVASRSLSAAALALALVLDTADGHLARLQGTASEFGRWLDAYLDELGDLALHGAIAWAAYTHSGQAAWLVAGMAYGMGKYLFVTGNSIAAGPGHAAASDLTWSFDAAEKHVNSSGAWRGLCVRLIGAVRAAGHADLRWHLWIALAAIGRLEWALAAYAAYYPLRSLGAAMGKAVRHG